MNESEVAQSEEADMPLDGKHALITGSSRGIGRGIALKLAENRVNRAVPTINASEEKMAFAPIGVEEYVKLHMQSNLDEDPVDLLKRLRMCVSEALAGARCHCGEPIWVIGSTFVGHMCFTCITGEADPSEDYEIDEVLEARRASDTEWPW